MHMQAEIPSGSWPLEGAVTRAASFGRKLRDPEMLRRLAITVGVMAAVLVGTMDASGYLLRRHREAVLSENLAFMRSMIREYTKDEHHAPHRLMDLVEAGYITELPADPFTGVADWDPDFANVPESVDREHFGIVDVHSRSTQRGRDGRAYCQW